jgi:hypothetical protein
MAVRIDQETYKRLKAYFTKLALRRPADVIAEELRALPFEPYAPIRRQLLNLLRGVNHLREQVGLEVLTSSCLRLRRSVHRPFSENAVP